MFLQIHNLFVSMKTHRFASSRQRQGLAVALSGGQSCSRQALALAISNALFSLYRAQYSEGYRAGYDSERSRY